MSGGIAFDLLEFEEKCFERIWGGQKLRTQFGMNAPEGNIGEAWLVSDHSVHVSVVADGPCAGMTLAQLLAKDPAAILGHRSQLTIHGRFPLMLKILDAREALSVQVHPDDKTAKRLGEPDVGKTEMWYVLRSDPGSELVCGLAPELGPAEFEQAAKSGEIEQFMFKHRASVGEIMFVAAGTVHAIGAGLVLAEIQQNSDLTYRIYDWKRIDAEGNPRQLHLAKSRQAIHFGSSPPMTSGAIQYDEEGATVGVLAACQHFAAERIDIHSQFRRENMGRTFHILLAESGQIDVEVGNSSKTLTPQRAVLVPGARQEFRLRGRGRVLDYYVPDIGTDIVAPLRCHGIPQEQIDAIIFE